MAGVSIEDLTERYPSSKNQLDKELSEEHLEKVTGIIPDHKVVGPQLGLTESEMTAINSNGSTHDLQKVGTLRKWKQKFAFKATYRQLITALLKCTRADLAQEVCELLTESLPLEQPTAATHSDASCQTDHHITTTVGTERGQRLPSPQYSSGNTSDAHGSSQSSSGYDSSIQNYTGKKQLAQPKQEEIPAPISDDEHLKRLLQIKFKRMKTSYEVLLKSCGKLFKKKRFALEEVREKAMDYHEQLQFNRKTFCTMSMDEIWDVIKKRTSWHNSHVVEDLVELNEDNHAHKSLKQFQKTRYKLVQFLKCNEEAGKKAKIVLKLEEDFKKFTEDKLEQVCLMVCDLLNTTTCPLRVQEGCVEITMSILAVVAEDVIPLSPDLKEAFQKAFPTLISISCGRYTEIFETAQDTDDSTLLDGHEMCLNEDYSDEEYFADGSDSDEECGKRNKAPKRTHMGSQTVAVGKPGLRESSPQCSSNDTNDTEDMISLPHGYESHDKEWICQEKDLQLLLKLVGFAAPKWREFGLELGFHMTELKEIEASVTLIAGGHEPCFRELLRRWLHWAPPKYSFPFARTLVEALRSETVQKQRLAYDLEQHFCQTGAAGCGSTTEDTIFSERGCHDLQKAGTL